MDGKRRRDSELLLNLTLKIIYLLTGENYRPVKKASKYMKPIWEQNTSYGWSRNHRSMVELSTVPPIPELEILDLANKIIELLTGEVPIRYQDVTVYFTTEEWEYFEGHKDQYKDVLMEDHPPLTSSGKDLSRPIYQESQNVSIWSPDRQIGRTEVLPESEAVQYTPVSSSKINSSERCFSSKDCLPKSGSSLQAHQVEDLKIIKVEVLDDEEDVYGQSSLDHDEIGLDGAIKKNLSERCFSPPYSQESPQESNEERQDEDQIDIKVCIVGAEDETRAREDENQMEEDSLTDFSLNPPRSGSRSKGCLGSFSHYAEKELTVIGDCATSPRIHSFPHGFDFTYDSLTYGSFSSDPLRTVNDTTRSFHNLTYLPHDMGTAVDLVSKSFPCPECDKLFRFKWHLNKHLRIHRGDKPYPCYECGLRFKEKFNLTNHLKIHTGERNFLCSQCGKRFSTKSNLLEHIRVHTGEKPFPCSECGKCFKNKSHLVEHQRIHTGEKPFPCSECGKGFTSKSRLLKHLRVHTGEKPFSCSACPKSFTQKAHLLRHQKSHHNI